MKVIITFIDNMVIEHWKGATEANCCCCPHLNRSRKRSKTIICSLGNIDFELIIRVYQAQVLEEDDGSRFVVTFPNYITKAIQYGLSVKSF